MTSIMQKSFAGGELSPALYSRTDLSKYSIALRQCRNFYIMRHGGAQNRAGTKFIGEVKDSSKTVRLIPFVFNQSQTYVLEFGDQYMRVVKGDSHVTLAAQGITGITNANPCVVTYSGSDNYANGNEIYISGITGAIGQYLNNRNFKVSNVNTGANTFELKYMDGTTSVNSTTFGSYTSGGTIEEIYEIATPYLEADLPLLKFVQSADVITIVHPSYAPRNLSRIADDNWTLGTITFDAEIDYPYNLSATQNGTTGSTTYKYTVTAFDPLLGQETPMKAVPPSGSYLATVSNGNATLSSVNSITVSWTLSATYGYSASELEFNIYREQNGIYGYIGSSSGTTSFTDIGYSIDVTDTPPRISEDFNASGDYPSCITYYQQRLMLANTDNDVEKVYGSKTGGFYDFSTSSPIQDDDAVIFRLSGRQINEVHHLVDLGSLLMFTESGEFTAAGGSSGVLTPSSINTRQSSYNGSSPRLSPIVIGNSAVYVQARGNNIRDINFQYESDNYSGDELSIYSSHLVDDYTLVDWTYQQIPHSILWTVRDDGVLLGLTYVKNQQMLAWHRHDFENGLVENVASVPSGSEDNVYLVINRTIDGREVRYIERMTTRKISDVKDIAILDCHLGYDGRNTNTAHTMILSGSGWTYTDTLTLTSSTGYFAASDVGNQIQIYDTDGSVIRFTIDSYTSSTVVTGRPNRTVPVSMRAIAISNWVKAVDEISGLWHLEGETVSVYADGFVVGSPYNPSYIEVVVADGKVTLSEKYGVILVGLPIVSDIETLNIDNAGVETMADRNKLISKVSLFVENSRGVWAGSEPPDESVSVLNGLTELKVRENEGYDDPVNLATDIVDVILQASWNNNGRVFIRQIDPIPLTILSITPSGYMPFAGG